MDPRERFLREVSILFGRIARTFEDAEEKGLPFDAPKPMGAIRQYIGYIPFDFTAAAEAGIPPDYSNI